MIKKLPNISAEFRKIVQATEAAIIADTSVVFPSDLPKKLYFMSGNLKEITARLKQLTDASMSDKKYPLICLIRDFKEKIEEGDKGIRTYFKPTVLIVMRTDPIYRSEDRETKNFIPVLHPIYEHLLYQFTMSTVFGMPTINELKADKTDCYFYGSSYNNKNEFNDYVDAIEISSINLNINNNICP